MARKPERYMQNARIQFVSLVDRAANRREFLTRKDARGNEEQVVQVPVLKRDDISEDGVRYITGVAYEPGVVDTQGDQMTASEIAKAAHRYMRDYRGVDVQHSNTPEDGCWVAESTVHKSATTISGQPVPEGAWTVTVGIENPEVIAKVDSGELNGLSIGGFAQYVLKADMPPQEDPAPQGEQGMFRKLFAWLGESLGLLKPSQDTQATPAAPQPLSPSRPEPANNQPPGPQPDTGNKEVHRTMTTAEFNDIMSALKETLAAKGLVEAEPQPQPQPAPFQKSDTADLASAITEAVAKGFRDAQKAAQPASVPPQPVGKSDTAQGDPQDDPKPVEKTDGSSSSTIDTDTLMTCIKSAVQQELEPMRERVDAIAKSHNMPTNIKDPTAKVEKGDHYMDGFFAE